MCLDVAGLAANLYRRNTPLIKIPTTVMAAVDASIGIKTAVNFHGRKNKMGTYCAPLAVFIDKTFLKTIGDRHLTNGSAEILKMACIKDAELFELLEEHSAELIQTKFQVGVAVCCQIFAGHGCCMCADILPSIQYCMFCCYNNIGWLVIIALQLRMIAVFQVNVPFGAESSCIHHNEAVHSRHAGGARVQPMGAHPVALGGLWPCLLS